MNPISHARSETAQTCVPIASTSPCPAARRRSQAARRLPPRHSHVNCRESDAEERRCPSGRQVSGVSMPAERGTCCSTRRSALSSKRATSAYKSRTSPRRPVSLPPPPTKTSRNATRSLRSCSAGRWAATRYRRRRARQPDTGPVCPGSPSFITAHIVRAFEAAIRDWTADRVPDALSHLDTLLDLTFRDTLGLSGPALQDRVTAVSRHPDAKADEPTVPGAGETDEPHR